MGEANFIWGALFGVSVSLVSLIIGLILGKKIGHRTIRTSYYWERGENRYDRNTDLYHGPAPETEPAP